MRPGFAAVAFLSFSAELQPGGEVAAEISPGFVSAALSEKLWSLCGQGHELFGQFDDFSWKSPNGGNR